MEHYKILPIKIEVQYKTISANQQHRWFSVRFVDEFNIKFSSKSLK